MKHQCLASSVSRSSISSDFPSVACFRCRRRPLYRRERGKVFGLNTLCARKGRFCPKRHRRPTFPLSGKSVLTSMDGEEAGGCETVIRCHGRNVCGFVFSFPSVCPSPLRSCLPLSWHIPGWWRYSSAPSSWLCFRSIYSQK